VLVRKVPLKGKEALNKQNC